MNKVTRFFWLFPAALLGWQSQVLAANFLDIEFSGELIGSSCTVATESMNKNITIYNLRRQFINENEKSDVTPFTIAIDKCSDIDLQKSIKITWKNNELVSVGGVDFLTTSGESGVLLGLVDKDGNPIIWNEPMTIGNVTVVEGLQQFDFGVFVRKPATGEARIGDFSGIATFNVEYE
ncbi:fimbrial protein [uncultured Cedecea sp.]|uniref:fimbrial protein n=1 Tax=uncultured Cedecea sp. TaxID=988762 RepID=UPI002629BA5A|nr:fimbrial protein [uncultured Cedecea sp.]